MRTTEFGKLQDKLAEHLTGTTRDTLRDVHDDVSYEGLSAAMEMALEGAKGPGAVSEAVMNDVK